MKKEKKLQLSYWTKAPSLQLPLQLLLEKLLDIYAGDKVKVDDAVTLSENSDIGKPTVKKYTAAEGEIILGIAVNDSITMTGGKRKTAILVLGHLFRLKLASGLSNINVKDRIALTSTGAIKSDDGEYIAMHPVASSDDYNYIEVFRPYDIGEA